MTKMKLRMFFEEVTFGECRNLFYRMHLFRTSMKVNEMKFAANSLALVGFH